MIINTQLPPISAIMKDMFFTSASNENDDEVITADEWYYSGRRVPYDIIQRRIVSSSSSSKKNNSSSSNIVHVFEKVVLEPQHVNVNTRWITFLPGLPNGSYGYSKIEQQFVASSSRNQQLPRLYIEYIGQGDSDATSPSPPQQQQNATNKTKNKNTIAPGHSMLDRADLVQAQWLAHQVRRTVIVTYDYSSFVLMELLRRNQERRQANQVPYTMIEHVMIINGPLSYLLKHDKNNTIRSAATSPITKPIIIPLAKRSNYILDSMILKKLYSIEYQNRIGKKLLRQEMKETRQTIRRHYNDKILLSKQFTSSPSSSIANTSNNNNTNTNNQSSTSSSKKSISNYYKKRWDISTIYTEYCMNYGTTIDLICSKHHIYEKQYQSCQEQLGNIYYPQVRFEYITCGHMILYEETKSIYGKILHLSSKGYSSDTTTQRSWVTMELPYQSSMKPPTISSVYEDTVVSNTNKRSWVTLL